MSIEENIMETAGSLKTAEETVYAALVELGVDPNAIRHDATLAELYIDSLDLIELGNIIEEDYGIEMTPDDLTRVLTVGDAIKLIGDRAGS
jgi:acyl carrier protein